MLTDLLLDFLKKSEDGRIINVSSNSHQLNAKPDFEDIELAKHYNPLVAYGNAKLFLIWITQYLSKTIQKQGYENLTVNTLHPGAVKTNFGKDSDLGAILNFFSKLARPFFKTPEQGAETIIYLATSDDVKNVSGKYFVNKEQKKVSDKYYSIANGKLIWDYCIK